MALREGSWSRSVEVVKPRSRVRATSPPPDHRAASPDADFACAYEIDRRPDDERSAEQWARAAWEGAPAPMRWFMLAGWRLVLGLRLGPRPSADHILGWRIVDRRQERTVCRLRSWFLDASNTFQTVDGRLVWSTFVTYERPIGRLIWPPVSLLHRPLVRIALRRAWSRR
jgi:hypothetical protein